MVQTPPVASLCAAAMAAVVFQQRRLRSGYRGRCYKRRRMVWSERCAGLRQGRRRERQFIARYRMTEAAFTDLAKKLQDGSAAVEVLI